MANCFHTKFTVKNSISTRETARRLGVSPHPVSRLMIMYGTKGDVFDFPKICMAQSQGRAFS